MIKGGGIKVMNWDWRMCNMTFEGTVVPKYWGSALIVPLHKGN